VRITHFAFDFGAGDQCGDGVDDDEIDGIGADQQLANLQGLFAGVGLGDEQVVETDAEALGPGGIEGVFGVDEGGHAAEFLCAGDDVEGECGFAGRFRPENLQHPAARNSKSAQGDIKT
jgi:hypothetical protein